MKVASAFEGLKLVCVGRSSKVLSRTGLHGDAPQSTLLIQLIRSHDLILLLSEAAPPGAGEVN